MLSLLTEGNLNIGIKEQIVFQRYVTTKLIKYVVLILRLLQLPILMAYALLKALNFRLEINLKQPIKLYRRKSMARKCLIQKRLKHKS